MKLKKTAAAPKSKPLSTDSTVENSLSPAEQEFLNAVERGEFESMLTSERRKELESIAANTLDRNHRPETLLSRQKETE